MKKAVDFMIACSTQKRNRLLYSDKMVFTAMLDHTISTECGLVGRTCECRSRPTCNTWGRCAGNHCTLIINLILTLTGLNVLAAMQRSNQLLNHVMQSVLRREVIISEQDLNRVDIYFEEVRLHSDGDPFIGPYVMPLVTLRTNPCRWSMSAGCVMCGYHLGAPRTEVTDENLEAQTQDAIARLDPQRYPSLVFTSNGSFLDPREVSDSVRLRLVAMLREAGFRFLVVESRPEFLKEGQLAAMAKAFSPDSWAEGKGLPISISFGLESANDFVQQYCINKGRRRADYIQAFDRLGQMGFSYDCYVMLGKPFMTAKEDVADAESTIRFAVDHGAEYVFVMVTNLVDYSLTGYLRDRGRYQLPSLWRAVELLERLPERYRRAVMIKGISHAPVPPKHYARTCERCTEHVKGCINFWNQTGDLEHLRSIHPCGCRTDFEQGEWARSVSEPLPERIAREYHIIGDELGIDPKLQPDPGILRESWEASR